jgi:hypothetical protein
MKSYSKRTAGAVPANHWAASGFCALFTPSWVEAVVLQVIVVQVGAAARSAAVPLSTGDACAAEWHSAPNVWVFGPTNTHIQMLITKSTSHDISALHPVAGSVLNMNAF